MQNGTYDRALERRCKRLDRALEEGAQRLRQVQGDFEDFREAARRKPEAALRAEIATLVGERAELGAALEQERADRAVQQAHTQQLRCQLEKLARELHRLRREKEAGAARALEQLRLQYLAREERYVLDGDRAQLAAIRDELGALRKQAAAAPPPAPTQ